MDRRRRRWRVERRVIECLLLGKSANETARELRVCKKTVKRIRERAAQCGYLDGTKALPQPPQHVFEESSECGAVVSEVDQRLLAQRDWISERLAAGWHSITVFEELPITVSRASFYRFLRRHKLSNNDNNRRVIPEIVHAEGEALQLDWGKLTSAMINGKRCSVWVLIGVLGHSRYRMARVMLKCDLASTLVAIRSMLEEIGGSPKRLTTDNPKVFSLLADTYEPLLHPAFERFCAYYGTIAECLPPREPQMKGKVERQVPFIRRLWEAHGEWIGVEDAQTYLDKKLLLANANRHGSTHKRPSEELETERAALKALPVSAFEIEEYHVGSVRRDGHVRFRGKYYSVDERYMGKEVTLIGTAALVSIYESGHLLEVHDRIPWNSPQTKSTKLQHLKPWERAMKDDSLYALRARAMGPAVEQMVMALIGRGNGFIDYRRVWGVLSLDKKYPKDKINEACEIALALDRLSYAYVARLLKNPVVAAATSEPRPDTQSAKFVRPLDEYKRHIVLTLIHGEKKDEPRNNPPTTASTSHAYGSK